MSDSSASHQAPALHLQAKIYSLWVLWSLWKLMIIHQLSWFLNDWASPHQDQLSFKFFRFSDNANTGKYLVWLLDVSFEKREAV